MNQIQPDATLISNMTYQPNMTYNCKTLIYKIVCNDLNVLDSYVASTLNYKSRKNSHKSNCYNNFSPQYNNKLYTFIRENGGWDNFTMVLIEEYLYNGSKLVAKARERYWFEQLNTGLNTNSPQRSKACI
jgi:hypothetical protein